MELNEYLRIFRRRWILILVSTLCGVIAAGIVSALISPKFDAQAVLFVSADAESSSSYENSQFVLQRVKSYPDLVYSPQVLNPVLQELDSSLTLSEVRKQVAASNPAETVHLNVSASAGSAEEAATLANLVAQNLRDVIRQLEGGDTARDASVEAFVAVPAVAPDGASSPNLALNLAIGLLAGLAVGLISALLLGSGRRKVNGSADLPRSFNVDIIGSIAVTPRTGGAPSQETALQYRELLTALLIKRGGHMPRLVLVTAAGQHSDAYGAFGDQFAGFISDSGVRTCVIDSTEQPLRPEGDDQAGADPGFSDVLVGEATVNDLVPLTGDSRPRRIPIGTSADRISRSQAARQGATILKELNDRFDVMLVKTSYDSHPLTTSTVALVSEAALVLVSSGTPVARLEDSLRELQAVGVEPLGVVLLGEPRRRRGRGRSRAHVLVRTSASA